MQEFLIEPYSRHRLMTASMACSARPNTWIGVCFEYEFHSGPF
jgi:hypothetical protein